MATCISPQGDAQILLAVHEQDLEEQLAVLIRDGQVAKRWHRGEPTEPIMASEFKAALREAISGGSAGGGAQYC
jgi:hypothetical protein